MPRKIDQATWVARATEIHDGYYDYSLVKYVNTHTKVTIICPVHGVFEQTPVAHVSQKQDCPQCANKFKAESMRLDTSTFVENAIQTHGDIYDYTLVEYVDMMTKIKIICPEHGIFEQLPSNHIHRTAGCPRCLGLCLDNQDFINKAQKIHGTAYDYSKIDYINKYTKVSIICPKHGEFEQTSAVHISSKCGCPKCNVSKGEVLVREVLTELNISFEEQYKFDGCRGDKYPLRFDFYIPSQRVAIEYDGIQHHQFFRKWHKTEEGFAKVKERDRIKNDYCESNTITLIRLTEPNKKQIQEALSFLNLLIENNARKALLHLNLHCSIKE